MPVFMDPLTEITAFLVITVLAVPAFILLCFMFEESDQWVRKPKDSFEDIPFFCGMCAMSDILSPASASLACFFFLAMTVFFLAGSASLWYMIWRGCVTANMGGARLEDTVGVFDNMLQVSSHALAHGFWWGQHGGPANVAAAGAAHWASAGAAPAGMVLAEAAPSLWEARAMGLGASMPGSEAAVGVGAFSAFVRSHAGPGSRTEVQTPVGAEEQPAAVTPGGAPGATLRAAIRRRLLRSKGD